jgi:FkbM family methyltransferase
MESGYGKYIFEGIKYYLKALLFVRPVKRVVMRFIKRVLIGRPYEFSSWKVFVNYNRDVDVLFVDGISHCSYALSYGDEERVVKLLKCLLNALDHGALVDVGAYVGFYTVLAAKHGWRVVAFEPNPISLILLRYNIALHGIEDRVVIVGKAAGDVQGYARFSIASNPSKSSSTKYLWDEPRLVDIVVEVTTIDSVLESLGVKDVSSLVVKVDVEGFGLRVLRGAMRTIEKFKPFILFEVHRTFDEEDEIYALRMLKDLGYGFVVVEPRSKRNFIIYAYPRERGCLCCERI